MKVCIDLKDLYEEYKKKRLLKFVDRPVSTNFEVMAVLKKTKGKLPVSFRCVEHYQNETVSGFGGTRELLAGSMGIKARELRQHLSDAIVNGVPTHMVQNAPCQENVVTGEFNIDDYFPILRHYEKDNGRFVISGVLVIKSEDGSKHYLSVRRMSYLGGNKMTIMAATPGLKEMLKNKALEKSPLEIALMFGVVPAVVLSSQISTQLYEVDKYQAAGALLGTSLPVTRCKTVDIDVLANAQVVLEGKIYPWKLEEEGPFGEMAYYYGVPCQLPVCEFHCMTYQAQPLWQTFFPSGCEEKLPMAVSREVNLFQTVSMTVPNIKDVNMTMGGAGRFHAVLQVKKMKATDGMQAALAAFASDKDLKHVVVVDEDVDLWDMEEVEWAIATRVQADRDVFVVRGADGTALDASYSLQESAAKAGIDATAPLNHDKFIRTHIPGEEDICLENYFKE